MREIEQVIQDRSDDVILCDFRRPGPKRPKSEISRQILELARQLALLNQLVGAKPKLEGTAE